MHQFVACQQPIKLCAVEKEDKEVHMTLLSGLFSPFFNMTWIHLLIFQILFFKINICETLAKIHQDKKLANPFYIPLLHFTPFFSLAVGSKFYSWVSNQSTLVDYIQIWLLKIQIKVIEDVFGMFLSQTNRLLF